MLQGGVAKLVSRLVMLKAKRDEEIFSIFEVMATGGVVVCYHFLSFQPS